MVSGMLRRVRGSGLAAVVGVMAAAAVGQPAGQNGKLIERYDPQEWTLKVTVNVRAHTEYDRKTGMPDRQPFDFTSAAVVFPLIQGTASSESAGGTGTLSLNDQ